MYIKQIIIQGFKRYACKDMDVVAAPDWPTVTRTKRSLNPSVLTATLSLVEMDRERVTSSRVCVNSAKGQMDWRLTSMDSHSIRVVRCIHTNGQGRATGTSSCKWDGVREGKEPALSN